MNCPKIEQWQLLSMDLLNEAESAELLTHAQGCDACRMAYGSARRDHARLLRSFEVFDRRHDRLREELMASVRHELPRRPRVPRLVWAWHGIGGVLMNLNTANRRVAAVLVPAACILIAVGIFLIPGRSAVAFAAVLERMRQARTMVCDYTTVSTMVFEAENRTEERTYHGKLSTYSDGTTRAWRMDQTDPPSTQWTFPDHSVNIDADGKRTVIRYAERPNPYERCETPEWWLNRLLKLTEAPDRELGPETLDGRKVVGFEIAGWKLGYGVRPTPGVDTTTAPTAVVRLWVDASTRLPVRMHVEDVVAMRMPGIVSTRVSMTWDHIEWDVPLDSQAFQAPPPVAGAPVEEWEVNATEQGLLDGLRAYAAAAERVKALLGGRLLEIADLIQQKAADDAQAERARGIKEAICDFLHGYPKQLHQHAIVKLAAVAPNISLAKVLAARASGSVEAIAQAEEEQKRFPEELAGLMQKLPGVIVFYRQLLLEEREPEYFGATVKPGDSDAVLMRWKLDDHHWRVIYGDLRAETVPMDEQPNGDVSLDSQSVQPPAPAASAPVQEEKLDMAVPTEEALLAGLRAYAAAIERVKALIGERFADLPQLMEPQQSDDPETTLARAALGSILEVLAHGYPRQLDQGAILKASITLPSQVRARVIVARASGDAKAIARAEEEEQQFHEEFADFPRTMQAMLVFYRQLLVEDREPDYFGATVKPGDSDAVLMRWKLDNDHWRVIYGDLRIETVPMGTQTDDSP